jgi:hypothetical protein
MILALIGFRGCQESIKMAEVENKEVAATMHQPSVQGGPVYNGDGVLQPKRKTRNVAKNAHQVARRRLRLQSIVHVVSDSSGV